MRTEKAQGKNIYQLVNTDDLKLFAKDTNSVD